MPALSLTLGTPFGGFVSLPPANTAAPAVTGTAVVGQDLSCSTGTWTGTAPITYTYQWYRNGVVIGGATNNTYTLVQADAGSVANIKCKVTATNVAGAVTQDSNTITQVLTIESNAWKGWIVANSGTITNALLGIFDDNFFIPAKANGNILNQLDRLNIYCGLVGYEIAARTNLLSSSFFVTPVNSPVFDANGYASDGSSSYLNLNYTPSTQAVKYTLNSAHYGYVVNAPTHSGEKRAMGATRSGGAGSFSIIFVEPSPSGLATYVNGDAVLSTDNNNPITVGNVFHSVRRNSSGSVDAIINANVVNNAAAPGAALANVSFYELVENRNGVANGPYHTRPHMASWNGSASLDYTAFRTLLNNLFTALGV